MKLKTILPFIVEDTKIKLIDDDADVAEYESFGLDTALFYGYAKDIPWRFLNWELACSSDDNDDVQEAIGIDGEYLFIFIKERK